MTALSIEHLTHRYGKTLALDDLSLTLPRGLTVGLIGPDGVGKSTLLGLIAGVRAIQRGELHVLGGDMRQPADRLALSHRIAYMPQGLGRNLYPTLSVYENIDFHARLFGLPARERRARIARLLEATGLAPFPDRATGKLSGGMKQKASLCCALVHAPDLLILDEPTTGVDPLSRRQFWALVADLQRETAGMTVLVATAYIEEAEPFAQLWAMDAGKLLVNAPTRDVMAGHANLEEAYIRLLPPEKQQGTGGLDLTPFVPDPRLPPAIEAHGLTKRFGDFTSVDNVSFTIQQGEIFGFLGSNGCGKSTTMKMLTGLLQATSGTAELLGAPVDAGSVATRMRVGYMSQAFSLYEELTVRQNLTLHARLYRLGARGKAAIKEALEQFDLADVADIKPAALPLGIRQRLQLAAACLHRPEVLILDEPTSGVDPAARDMFWRHLLRMSREDKITIFVTTHFMNEAARCDRISFMHQGRVLAIGTPAELVAQYHAPNLEEAFVQYLLLDEAAQKHASAGTEFLPAPTPTLPHGGGGLTVEEGTSDSTISDNEPPAITAGDTPTAAQSSTDLPPPQPSPAADASASCEGGSLPVGESPAGAESPAVLPPPSQRSAAGEGWGGGSARISSADVETSSATTANEPPTAAPSPAVQPPPSQRSAAGEGWGGGIVRISSADVETSSATTANEPPTAAPSPAVLPPLPVGEGGGGGSKQSSAASFQSLRGWLATIRTFAIREGKELLRDHVRTFFALFGPVILMTAVTWGVSFDVGNLAFAVRDRDQSAESRAIVEYFAGSSQFHQLPPLTADADIDTALESSSAKMIIDIPPSFGRDLLRGARPEIGFYLDGAESFNASNLTGYIASILGDYARDQAHAHGIRLPPDAAQLVPRFRYNPDFKSILAIAPGVLMLALSLFPAMMAAVGVVREREIGSIANFYASPASRLQFLLGKQLPYLAAAMLSFLILYLMMRYWFGVPLNGSAAALLTGTLLMCATTTATGLLVSCFTRSQVAAIFITAVGTVMPAMSFSGFLVPVSSLQGGAYIMGKILPSAWYANLTTGTFVKGLGYPDLVREHFILGGYYLIILTLAVLNLKKQER